MDNLKLWEVLRIIDGMDKSSIVLTKQDGNKYKIIDGVIVSMEKNPIPLVLDLEDRWNVKWLLTAKK